MRLEGDGGMTQTRKTDTNTLIESLLILANDIQSDDGIANAAIYEGACRIRELHNALDGLVYFLNHALHNDFNGFESYLRFNPTKAWHDNMYACKEALGILEKEGK
jgi:hypothetical protein